MPRTEPAKDTRSRCRYPRIEMYPKHVLIAAASGVVVYLILAFLFGPSGLNRYAARRQYYDEIRHNIDDLQRRGESLATEMEALRTSSDLLRLHARVLGYYRAREHRLVLDTMPDLSEPPSPGRLILRSFAYSDPRPALRVAAFVIAGGILALQTALGGSNARYRAAAKQHPNEKTNGRAAAQSVSAQSGSSKPRAPRLSYSRRVQTASRE